MYLIKFGITCVCYNAFSHKIIKERLYIIINIELILNNLIVISKNCICAN